MGTTNVTNITTVHRIGNHMVMTQILNTDETSGISVHIFDRLSFFVVVNTPLLNHVADVLTLKTLMTSLDV